MNFWSGLVLGLLIGVVLTLFTSLLTELFVVVVLVGAVFYLGRKRWAKQQKADTPSMTNTSP